MPVRELKTVFGISIAYGWLPRAAQQTECGARHKTAQQMQQHWFGFVYRRQGAPALRSMQV